MKDDRTTIQDLKEEVKVFCEAREWDQFHNQKDLAIGMVTEASELLQIFRFKDQDDIMEIMEDPEYCTMIRDELSDVLYFVLRFAHMNDIDLSSSFIEKLRKNEEKYPEDISRGSNKKYNEL
ncbi:MAG TPA: nucleotide pyrophosphohydrolase [Candidatus Methanomethylophilaceae archaeon]|nr:nucleotide pyrophosphohydrolase [Candidatus Methanomethylophilaceae archaeon]